MKKEKLTTASAKDYDFYLKNDMIGPSMKMN